MLDVLTDVRRNAVVTCAMLALLQVPVQAKAKEQPVQHPTHYRATRIDGISIFYREAGPKDAPTLLLLHGVPSSPGMLEPLFPSLSARYHRVAPDYPRF